ncbi:hypothetical protein EIP86_001905 [Pleurotus ostreatoroseus]|nr:hypothetical protein EIP86_001905 [Pleurotus ostreatoroseus]
MTQEDVRIIFNNIAEIAEFADQFTEMLEDALGSVVEGGTGVDHVGALFLDMIPDLESLYSTYITRHPTALEHLNKLEKTELLKEYLERTQTLAQTLSHAWDLASLLIKPVQRLMKYALLLTAIIDETPASHPDKENLKLARERVETVTHGVNEGRRRREVVKEVLCSKRPIDIKPKKKGLNLGIAASINLGRVKSIRASTFKVKDGREGNLEAEQVARMGEELKACQVFSRNFAREALAWIDEMTALTHHLLDWAKRFGNVTGANAENHSAAYDAFLLLIEHGLLQICTQFKQVVHVRLLPQLARLTDSTNMPEKLLEAMRTLEPLHYGLLNVNIAKTRPPPELQQASQSYVAIRAQLYGELPQFLECYERGVKILFRQLIEWQTEFWRAYRQKWQELWDALRVEGEMEGSAQETLRVWWSRFYDIAEVVEGLNIIRPFQEPQRPQRRQRGYSFSDAIETGSTLSTVVISTMAALDAVRAPSMASSHTLVPSSPSSAKSQQLEKKMSSESVHSKKSGRSGRSHKHSNSSMSQVPLPLPVPTNANRSELFTTEDPAMAYAHVIHTIVSNPPQKPAYHRTASMPISLPMPLRKSNSQGRLLDGGGGPGNRMSLPAATRNSPHGTPNQSQQFDPYAGYDEDPSRGRSPRKPSTKRRGKDSSASASASRPRTHRSPSLPTSKNLNFSSTSSSSLSSQTTPQQQQHPFPSTSSSPLDQIRATWARRPGLYQCHAIHPCSPPPGVSYRDIPFLTIRVGDIFDVLEEKGHPSQHRNLPLYIDDGEDCLLLVRDMHDDIGWALASFLFPVG